MISLIIKLLIKLPTKTKRAPKSLQKYNSETNGYILRKKIIPLDLRQKIINGLILKEENY